MLKRVFVASTLVRQSLVGAILVLVAFVLASGFQSTTELDSDRA